MKAKLHTFAVVEALWRGLSRRRESRTMQAKRHTFADVEALWRAVGAKPQLDAPYPLQVAADRYDVSITVDEWLRRQARKPSVGHEVVPRRNSHVAFVEWLRRRIRGNRTSHVLAFHSDYVDRYGTAHLGAHPALIPGPGLLHDTAPFRANAVPRTTHDVRPKLAAVVVVLALAILLTAMGKAAWIDRSVEAGLGEWRVLRLADGSSVRIGPDTQLRFSFGDHHRLVRLSSGEAYFEVASERGRPFVVDTEFVNVRAVGTAFGVQTKGGDVVVTVKEGLVEVAPKAVAANGDPPANINVAAGEQVVLSGSADVVARRVDLDQELAWTEGLLVFSGEDTIGHAIQELNRRNRQQIAISDSAIASRRIRGIFRADDPWSFAMAIARGSDVRVQLDGDVLRLVPAPGGTRERINESTPR